MNILDYFNQLEAFFKEEEFETFFSEASEEQPFDELFVELPTDHYPHPVVLQIRPLGVAPVPNEIEGSPTDLISWQFFIILPFPLKQEATVDTLRLINFLNSQLELGYFGWLEKGDFLFFRYVNLFSLSELDKVQLEAIIGTILLTLDGITPLLQEIATGKKSLEEFLKTENPET